MSHALLLAPRQPPCARCLDAYRALLDDYTRRSRERTATLARAQQELATLVREQAPTASVRGRIKSFASAWGKARRKRLELDQIVDVVGVRVIVDTIPEVYSLIDRVHAGFGILAAEYDDYIRRPKPNGYRSLHTTLRSRRGDLVELQVRTWQMHAQAEWGTAAHRRYKRACACSGIPCALGPDGARASSDAAMCEPWRCAG